MKGENSWDVDGLEDSANPMEPIIDYGKPVSIRKDEGPSVDLIERTARTVAGALGDNLHDKAQAPDPILYMIVASPDGNSYQTPADYLSDHRVLARYLAHVKDIWTKENDVDWQLCDRLEGAMKKAKKDAWANPLPAIIALVESVGGAADGECHYSHDHLVEPYMRCMKCGAAGIDA